MVCKFVYIRWPESFGGCCIHTTTSPTTVTTTCSCKLQEVCILYKNKIHTYMPWLRKQRFLVLASALVYFDLPPSEISDASYTTGFFKPIALASAARRSFDFI